MPFSRTQFQRYRPWLYHFTAPENLPLLRRERIMLSAAAWVERANAFQPQIADPEAFLGAPRLRRHPLQVGPGLQVLLNDQVPLRYESSFHGLRGTYSDYIRYLNGLIFFWPGTAVKPTPRGKLADTFAARDPGKILLRVPTMAVWPEDEGEGSSSIRFCRYNSGAPQARDGVTRGPHLFVTCAEAPFGVPFVAEVVFPHRLVLPAHTEWKFPGQQHWQPL